MATYYKGDGTQITIPDVGSVNTAQLVDNAVTYNKLAEAVQDQLGTSTETEERLDDIEAQIDELAEAIESVDIETDTTLSISGKPADAKVVGDDINTVNIGYVPLKWTDNTIILRDSGVAQAWNNYSATGYIAVPPYAYLLSYTHGGHYVWSARYDANKDYVEARVWDVLNQDFYNDSADFVYFRLSGETATVKNVEFMLIKSIDKTLTKSGYPADAKAVGDAIADIESGGSGLTDGAKQALLNCFAHVAWIDEHGQDYYDALENALYPPATLTSISCVYTQSGTVYDTDSLDVLKDDLVVTAHYDNGTTQTVTTYTLSGTLTEGTSVITVAYGGKTTTFNVTVTHATVQYTITNNLTDCTNSNSATRINELTPYSGTLSTISGYIISDVTITMGSNDITSTAYDSSTGGISIDSVTGNIVITAIAIEDLGWISGQAYDLTEYPNKQNVVVDTTTESGYSSSANHTATDKLPCHGANAMYLPDGVADKRAYYNQDGSGLSQSAMNSTWGAQNWIPVESDAYYFACSNYTANLPLTATVVPYKLTTLGENVAVEVGEHYAVEKNDTSYMFCYGMTTLKLVHPARRKIDFYDGNKQLLSTTGAQNNLITASVPEGAMYFKFDSGYGTSQNIAWFE